MREQGEGPKSDDGCGAEELATGTLRNHLFGSGFVAVEYAVDCGVSVPIGAQCGVQLTVDLKHSLEILLGQF